MKVGTNNDDIRLVAFIVIGVWLVRAFLGLVFLHKYLLLQLTCEALQQVFIQVHCQRWANMIEFLLIYWSGRVIVLVLEMNQGTLKTCIVAENKIGLETKMQ